MGGYSAAVLPAVVRAPDEGHSLESSRCLELLRSPSLNFLLGLKTELETEQKRPQFAAESRHRPRILRLQLEPALAIVTQPLICKETKTISHILKIGLIKIYSINWIVLFLRCKDICALARVVSKRSESLGWLKSHNNSI